MRELRIIRVAVFRARSGARGRAASVHGRVHFRHAFAYGLMLASVTVLLALAPFLTAGLASR